MLRDFLPIAEVYCSRAIPPEHHFSPFPEDPTPLSVELQQMLRPGRRVVAQPNPSPFLCGQYPPRRARRFATVRPAPSELKICRLCRHPGAVVTPGQAVSLHVQRLWPSSVAVGPLCSFLEGCRRRSSRLSRHQFRRYFEHGCRHVGVVNAIEERSRKPSAKLSWRYRHRGQWRRRNGGILDVIEANHRDVPARRKTYSCQSQTGTQCDHVAIADHSRRFGMNPKQLSHCNHAGLLRVLRLPDYARAQIKAGHRLFVSGNALLADNRKVGAAQIGDVSVTKFGKILSCCRRRFGVPDADMIEIGVIVTKLLYVA